MSTPVGFPPGPRAAPALAALNELTAIHVSSGTVLNGGWQGPPLNEYQLKLSEFSGTHYLMHLGHRVNVTLFRLTFIVRYPLEAGASDEAQADAERVAEAFMHMLNTRRLKETS